jgi:hypothetical protein
MSVQITLAVRPSLACPTRWSVDFWRDNRDTAAYQAASVTFNSLDDAEMVATNILPSFEQTGAAVVTSIVTQIRLEIIAKLNPRAKKA